MEMIRILRGPAAALLAVLVLASGANAASGDCRLIRGGTTPADPTDDVRACEQSTYFHRAGAPVANNGPIPSWNATAPTATDSAAYAGLIGGINTTSQTQPTFAGSFTGNIDTLRLDAFISIPIYENTGTPYPLTTTLTIDGTDVIVEDPAAAADVKDAPMSGTSETGVSKMSFAVKNLYGAMDSLGLDTGDDVTHQIQIKFASWYWGDSWSVVWFDSTARPSGIYFNPNKPTGLVLDALTYV
jgi:hypothetical protein